MTLQDWLRLSPANVCPPVKPRIIRALRTSSARPPWLRLIPPNSRRSGGLNLKGAGMKKCMPHTSQMSLLHRTERPEVFCHRGCSRRRTAGPGAAGSRKDGEEQNLKPAEPPHRHLVRLARTRPARVLVICCEL